MKFEEAIATNATESLVCLIVLETIICYVFLLLVECGESFFSSHIIFSGVWYLGFVSHLVTRPEIIFLQVGILCGFARYHLRQL